MEKRTLLALALCLLFIGFYPVILQKIYPDYRPGKPAAQAVSKTETQTKGAAATSAILKANEFLPTEDAPVRTGKVNLTFNQVGGGVREISFPGYVNAETKKPLTFISLKDSKAAPTSIVFSEPVDFPTRYAVQSAPGVLTMLSQGTGALAVSKEYRFRDSGYAADLTVTFENKTSAAVPLRYEIFAGSRISPRNGIDAQYIEANFAAPVGDTVTLKHIKETRAGKEVASAGPVRWVAIKDRHFSVIVRPETEGFTGLVRGLGDHHLSVSAVSPALSVPAGSAIQQKFLVYFGPNDVTPLIPLGLSEIVNFGKLDAIGKLLVGTLEMLNKVFHNYGLAIIALTLLINVVLFPLTRVSYMSMKRMQLIQPQMNKLREQNKKSPEKLNREMMALYKKHKVNPFGGCLPMFLQMPVFIALYVALSKSVILIDEKLLWIHDLSAPDRVPLPFSLPFLGNEIHILPLVMCLGMFLQQKLTMVKIEGQDPMIESQQRMMTFMMPIIFGFIFYTMPAGLVLYWLTNTVFMTLYQLRLKSLTLEK